MNRGLQTVLRRAGRLLLLLLPTLLPLLMQLTTSAQGTLQTLATNGAVSNRLNIVVLSEGYTTNDLASHFLQDATNAVNNLFAYQPYTEYQRYCNAYAISVASAQSGSSHTSPSYSGQGLRNTYFNSSYDSVYDYIITIPPNSQDANAADGQGKVNTLLTNLMPQCGLPVLQVNDLNDGGSGGPICIASLGAGSPQIIVHESGHTLGKLGDEYDYGYQDIIASFGEQPNTTTNTNAATIKWNAWIATNTPIPTPDTNLYATNVGLFQGANYNTTGWYRPKYDCLMQDLRATFCEVCSETLVKAIYQKVRPIDSFSPSSNTVSLTTTQAVAFSVVPLQPMTHNLTVQWYTNGTAVAGATNAAFNFPPPGVTNGTWTLRALVHDPTPFVRNDPSNLLSASVTWTVNLNRLQLDSLRWIPGGQFSFRVAGTAPDGFVLLGSTNLVNWTPLSTNSLFGGQFFYTNNAAAFTRRFYRAQILP